MSKRRIALASSLALALCACAADVVLKPAVNEFVGNSRTATDAITKSYQDFIDDTNKATAMMLAAHPECGFRQKILVRTPEIDRQLRSPSARSRAIAVARQRGIAVPRMPARGYCVTNFEVAVLQAAFPNSPYVSTRLQVLDASDFKPQLDTVHILTAYVAVLAELADAPKLTARADIEALAGGLRSAASEASGLAGDLSLLSHDRAVKFQGALKDGGPVAGYASAVAQLAGTLEEISKQDQDVRALRAKLLDPKNQIREQIIAIGQEADRWNAQHRLVRQAMVMSSQEGLEPQLPYMPFDDRVEAFSTYLRNHLEARPSLTAKSPYGAMMMELAKAHDDLQRIAREDYSPKEKRAMAAATLKRLGDVLKGIAGIAPLFL
jgi:hypothetical protein